MDKEYWINIKFKNYQISSNGRIKSLNYRNTGKEHILKPVKTKCGYLQVRLYDKNKYYHLYVHRLVAEAFLPNPDNLPCVNHKDECKTNNIVSNLEWCDYKYNSNFGTAIQRCSEKKINGKKSKSVLQYDLEGNLIKEWKSLSECGRNGFNPGSISACCRGKLKTHKKYIWKYKIKNK